MTSRSTGGPRPIHLAASLRRTLSCFTTRPAFHDHARDAVAVFFERFHEAVLGDEDVVAVFGGETGFLCRNACRARHVRAQLHRGRREFRAGALASEFRIAVSP